MVDTTRDRERLAEYEAELRDIDAKLEELLPLQARREGLAVVVDGLRRVVDAAAGRVPEPPREGGQRRAQRPGLKAMLAAKLETSGRLDVEEAIAFVASREEFAESPPTRNTVVSRLGDLVREGYAHSPSRGVYMPGPASPPDKGTLM